MAQNIVLQGATYSAVPSVNLPKQGGGTASFVDVTDTTAAAADVASGKYFYTSAGVRTAGTNSGGGGGSMTVDTKTTTLNAAASSIQFTGLSGNPLSFVVTSSADQTTGETKVVSVAYDGTSFHGMNITTQAENDTSFSKSYSSGTLTITATTAQFQANTYKLVYTYGGSSSDIHTDDVQVGSGATSITFAGLSGQPVYFSCLFKSTFSTSSGYQRVMDVVFDGTNTYGNALDSSAKALTAWSYSYSAGSLTITSAGTNNGGYFHQPGYYQLTYAVDPNAPNYQAKTNIGATTSSQTITADNGYDALASVQINAVSQTNLVAGNIKSGTTISISNGNNNLWSVTGTYTGGGGSSKNAQTAQSTTRSTSSTYTEVISLTCTKAGTYNVYWSTFRSSTSGTWGSQLYLDDTAYGTAETGSWSNHIQNIHLSNVSITANADVSVRVRTRGNSYYGYVGTLTIIEA